MKALLRAACAVLLGSQALAQTPELPDLPIFIDAETADLSEFVWEKRPIVVFADSPNDPNFKLQLEYIVKRAVELDERDVVVLTDTAPDDPSPLREKLRPRGFMMVLIGKDGGIKLRKPFPQDVRELMRSIDKMPMRIQEREERRTNVGG